MKKSIVVGLMLCFIFALPAQGGLTDQDLVMEAQGVLEELQAGNYEEVHAKFTSQLQEQLSVGELEEAWKSLEQIGQLEEIIAIQVEQVQAFQVVVLTARFPAVNIDINISFNTEGELAGLVFTMSEFQGEYLVPPYVEEERISEEIIEFGEEPWIISGKLTLPQGEGPWPVIILIGGSGPTDADGTLGGNKPYRDITWGLSTEGIASLRFDKRTRLYQEKLAAATDFTVREEYIEDTLFALDYVMSLAEIDQDQIYLAGHSQGGMILPRIAEEAENVKGLIYLAAPARGLEDLIWEQYNYLAGLEGEISPEIQAQLDMISAQMDNIKDPNLSPETPAAQLMGIVASYWLDLRDYDQLETVESLTQPMLFIQGGRDYQVTEEDFSMWKEVLEDRENVLFTLFPDLNHIFHYGEGMAVPGEYLIVGSVEFEVIQSIIDWIGEQ